MKGKAKKILLLLALVVPVCAWAQPAKINFRDRLGDTTRLVNTAVKPPKIKGPKALRGELSGGIRLNTDGYGIVVDKGWIKGGDNFGQNNNNRFFHVRLLQFELIEHKHPKEISSSSLFSGITPSSYILGKINKFYAFKIGYGRRQMIAGKPDPGTVSIHWVYLGGFSAGLVKPYYLRLRRSGDTKYSDSIIQEFVSPNNIEGKAPFTKGLNELKLVPGIHFKTGLHFDFSTSRKAVMALELGVNAEYYTSKIEQMVGQDPRALFLNFYGTLQFGKRW